MQSLRLFCGDLRWVDRCFYFSLLALDICVLWFVPDWDSVPLMVQIHFCSCNKHDWGYMLHEAASAAIFVLFFPCGATLSLLQLLHRTHAFLKLLMFCRIWDAVCLSVCLIFFCYFHLFFCFIHSINVLYIKNNVSFHFILYLSRLSRYLWSPSLILFSSLCQPFGVPWFLFFLTKWLVLNSFCDIQHTGFSIWEISL